MKKIELTTSQERALRSSLYLFERALRRVDQLLSSPDEIGILFHRKSNLDFQTRELIRGKISLTLIELKEFVQKLGLKPMEVTIERELIAEMSLSWESLEESRSKRMRGYGELSPQATRIIDPAIDHFARVALELSNMFSANSQLQESDLSQGT